MKKKNLTIANAKPDFSKVNDAWSKLSLDEQKRISNFLCLREMCYDQFKEMTEDSKKYLQMLFPEVSK